MKRNNIFEVTAFIVFCFAVQIQAFSFTAIDRSVENRNAFIRSAISAEMEFPPSAQSFETISPNRHKGPARRYSTEYYLSFLQGISASPNNQRKYFTRALERAGDDPGKLWVLFTGFSQAGKPAWEDRIITRLYKNQLQSGSSSAEIMSRLLTHLSYKHYRNNNTATARRMLTYSEKFSPLPLKQKTTEVFSTLESAGIAEVFHLIKSVVSYGESSWNYQLKLASVCFSFFAILIRSATIILFIIFLVKYYTLMVHKASCIYPKSIPYVLKILYVSLLILPLLVFAPYPFIIFSALFLFILIDNAAHKRIMFFVILGIISFPALQSIEADLAYILSSRSVPSIYRTALNEKTGESFQAKIYSRLENSDLSQKEKALLYTSLALSNLKNGDYNAASYYSDIAVRTTPDFEPVLITAGPAFLLNNEIDKGFTYIEQAHETAPFLASTNFNYNRAILDYRNHTYTGEYLQKASRINDKKIGTFADENNA
ncbi:MAG: hypothetical protein ACQEQ4_10845, partial [Fibrobacterota bacterium]